MITTDAQHAALGDCGLQLTNSDSISGPAALGMLLA
jgi:hypothetical protein